MLATTLATLALVPQLTLPVAGHAKDGVTHDPFTAAFHASAVCDCSEPLETYTRYGPIPAMYTDHDSGVPYHNDVFVNLLRFIHAKWDDSLPLEGYETVLVDFERLEQWNLYVETVRADHGLPAGYQPVWPEAVVRGPDGPIAPPSPSNDRIDMPECQDCADDMCDGRRILTYAQESIFGNAYTGEQIEDYYRHFFTSVTRLVGESFWLDIPVGHARPAPACNVGCNDTAQVHVQMVPGDGVTLSVPFFETQQPTMVFITAYQMCLLKSDGDWLCEQYPLYTSELNHRQVEYNQCHPAQPAPAPSGPGGNRPGSNGPCGHGFRPLP